MIKRKILAAVVVTAILCTAVGVRATTGVTQNDSPVVDRTALELALGRHDPSVNEQAATSTEETTPPADQSVTDSQNTSPTGDDENTPPPEDTEPPVPPAPPAPTRTGYHMHFVDVSPADKPNSRAEQYCDYTYSDGSVKTEWVSTINNTFKQPISNYNENNLPGLYSPC